VNTEAAVCFIISYTKWGLSTTPWLSFNADFLLCCLLEFLLVESICNEG